MMYIHHYNSPLGAITLAGSADALTGLWFDGQKYFGSTLGVLYEERDLPIFELAECWLDAYFNGKNPDFNVPIQINTTEFRKAVWDIMLTIPYGETMTYGEIAEKIAVDRGIDSMSAQAVGNAVGHNPISIIVPCHRVVGAHGELTGYAGGIDRKQQLLKIEGIYAL